MGLTLTSTKSSSSSPNSPRSGGSHTAALPTPGSPLAQPDTGGVQVAASLVWRTACTLMRLEIGGKTSGSPEETFFALLLFGSGLALKESGLPRLRQWVG